MRTVDHPSPSSDSSDCSYELFRLWLHFWAFDAALVKHAYESALKQVETMQHGASYARRVRSHANALLEPFTWELQLMVAVAGIQRGDTEISFAECNQAIPKLKMRLRLISEKAELYSRLHRLLAGTSALICEYCFWIGAELPVQGRFCSLKCRKRFLNRKNYLRRSSLSA